MHCKQEMLHDCANSEPCSVISDRLPLVISFKDPTAKKSNLVVLRVVVKKRLQLYGCLVFFAACRWKKLHYFTYHIIHDERCYKRPVCCSSVYVSCTNVVVPTLHMESTEKIIEVPFLRKLWKSYIQTNFVYVAN